MVQLRKIVVQLVKMDVGGQEIALTVSPQMVMSYVIYVMTASVQNVHHTMTMIAAQYVAYMATLTCQEETATVNQVTVDPIKAHSVHKMDAIQIARHVMLKEPTIIKTALHVIHLRMIYQIVTTMPFV